MAASRQPQLFANFIHAVKSCKPTTHQSIRTPPASRSKLHTTARRRQTTYPNRYGPAATESLPPPPKPAGSLAPKKDDSKTITVENQETARRASAPSSQPVAQTTTSPQKQTDKEKDAHMKKNEDQIAVVEPKADKSLSDKLNVVPVASAKQTQQQQQQQEDSISDLIPPEMDPSAPLQHKELDIMLSPPTAAEIRSLKSRHPHLEPSPYEHHFDTYSLVQELAKDPETFTEPQSITVMKAVRLMLAENLDLAKEGLVSKSDIENESYLFRAACSELRTTIQTTRAAENQRQRTQRASLQHEMDILNQKVTQDVQTMREDLKGMFNDRKMGLQEEKRKVDSQISELNYEITVLLNSEAKSEVEGLRWVLTRRAALAIATAAFMTLSALQYYSVKSREAAEIEKKRVAALKAQEEKIASETQSRYTTQNRDSGTQTGMREYEESLG